MFSLIRTELSTFLIRLSLCERSLPFFLFLLANSSYFKSFIFTFNRVSSTILKFVDFLVVNNNKYSSYVVDSIIFRISVPDYPGRTVRSDSLRSFWNFSYFVYFLIDSRLRNSDSAFFAIISSGYIFQNFAITAILGRMSWSGCSGFNLTNYFTINTCCMAQPH